MKTRTSIGVGLLLSLVAGDVRAEDPKSDSLTVLPFTSTSVAFSTDKEKRGVLGVDHRFRNGARLSLELSAPLDEGTREAAFLDGNKLAGGINLDAHIGYDSIYKALDLTEDERKMLDLEFCNKVNAAKRPKPAAPASPAPVQPPGPRAEPAPQPADSARPLDEAAVRSAAQEAIGVSKPHGTEAVKIAPDELMTGAEREVIHPCTANEIKKWGEAHPDRPEWREYQDTLARLREQKWRRAGREAAVRLVPSQLGCALAGGADFSVSYDRTSVYEEDLAADPVARSKYNIQGGARGTLYLAGQFALTLRAGGEITKGFTATKVQRCADVPSGEASVRGEACKDVLFVKDADDAPKASAYTRLSFTYVPLTLVGGGVPGFELRGGLERLGQTPRLNLRATGFFSPEMGILAGRFGVGLDLAETLGSDPGAGPSHGQIDVTPFIFIGVTPGELN